MKTVADVQKAIEKFQAEQKKYSSFGATDTEPSFKFQKSLFEYLTTGEVSLPKSWELFKMEGSERVEKILNLSLLDIITTIGQVPLKDLPQLREYFVKNRILWRITSLSDIFTKCLLTVKNMPV